MQNYRLAFIFFHTLISFRCLLVSIVSIKWLTVSLIFVPLKIIHLFFPPLTACAFLFVFGLKQFYCKPRYRFLFICFSLLSILDLWLIVFGQLYPLLFSDLVSPLILNTHMLKSLPIFSISLKICISYSFILLCFISVACFLPIPDSLRHVQSNSNLVQ